MKGDTLVTDRVLFFKVILLHLIASSSILAEGTRELAPNPTDRVYLYTNHSNYGYFGAFDGDEGHSLVFHVESPESEEVYLGFSYPTTNGHYPCNGVKTSVYIRIVGPNGDIVYPTRGNPAGQIIDSLTANISTWAEAVAGPQQIVGPGGYPAFRFDPTGLPAGDYRVEFNADPVSPRTGLHRAIEFWDITVAKKGITPTPVNGRVYSKAWALFVPSPSCGMDPVFTWFDRPFNGKFFVYTNEGTVSKVDFNNSGFQPAAFNALFNDTGPSGTGNVIVDRQSLYQIHSGLYQHKIFLNDPDPSVYPTGVIGDFTLLPRYISCPGGTSCVMFSVTEPGQIDILIDLDKSVRDLYYLEGSADIILAFKVEPLPGEQPPYQRCVPWDGHDGLGNFVPEADTIDMLVRYSQGIYHFPVFDAEFMLDGFTIETIRPVPPTGKPTKVYYDDRKIPVDPGTGISSNRTFNGDIMPGHNWSVKDFGDENTLNTWFFASEDLEVHLEPEPCPILVRDDTATTEIQEPVSIDVLLNDDFESTLNPKSIGFGDFHGKNGLVQMDDVNDQLIYDPEPSFIGLDTFLYVGCFDVIPVDALCDTAQVVVKVIGFPEDCSNGKDDDGDRQVDCDDPDCKPQQVMIIKRKN